MTVAGFTSTVWPSTRIVPLSSATPLSSTGPRTSRSIATEVAAPDRNFAPIDPRTVTTIPATRSSIPRPRSSATVVEALSVNSVPATWTLPNPATGPAAEPSASPEESEPYWDRSTFGQAASRKAERTRRSAAASLPPVIRSSQSPGRSFLP